MTTQEQKTILLVEDDMITAILETKHLKKEGYKVIHAENGENAIDIVCIKKEHVDLILMDIDLGSGIDGTEAAAEILKTNDIPLAFLSAHTEPEVVEKTEGINSYGYIVKGSGETVLSASVKMAFKLFDAKIKEKKTEESLRILAEEELRKSEKKFRNYIENAPDGIFIVDNTGSFIESNKAARQIIGYSEEEIKNVSIHDLLAEESLEAGLAHFNKTMGTGEAAEDLWHKHKDGSKCLLNINAVKLSDTRVLGFAKDITNHWNTNEALRDANIRFEQLTEQNRTIAWEVDSAGLYTYVSPAVETVLGYRPVELVGKKYFYDICPECERETLKQKAFKVFDRKDMFFGLENPVQTKDGRILWVSTNAIPLLNADGTLSGYLGADTDITERKQMEDSLIRSEDLFRGLAENIPACICSFLPDSTITYANPTLAEMTGMKSDKLVGRKFFDMLDPDDLETVKKGINSLTPSNPTECHEQIHIAPDGSKRYQEWRNRAFFDNEGKICRLLAVGFDITESKGVEKKLKESNNKLAERVKELNCLYGFASLIETEDDSPDKIYQGILDLIPTAYQYPDITCAKLVIDGHVFSTSNYKESKWQMKYDVIVNGNNIGDLIVGYLKEKPESDEGPFLKEERFLLNVIGERLGRVIQRKMMEDRLRKNEERLQEVMKNSPDAAYKRNLETNYYDYLSPAFFRISGYTSDEFTNLPLEIVLDLIHPDDLARVEGMIAESMSGTDGSWQVDYRFRNKDGQYRWFHDQSIVVKNEQGKPVARIGSVSDITDRKNTESKLIDFSQRLELAISSGNLGIWDWNVKENIMIWDKRMFELYGITPESSPNTLDAWTNGLHQADKQRAIDECNSALKGEKDFDTTFRVLHPDGTIIHIKADGIVIRDSMGLPLRMIGINRDITESKLSEEKIKALLAEKELILKEVHHRIKNNMNTINSLLLLHAAGIKEPSAIAALEDAGSRIRTMMVLYDKLYRTEKLGEMSIREYIQSLIVEIVKIFYNRDMVKIETRIDDFMIDAKKLSPLGIIINELITNAMKYAFTGRTDGVITVTASIKDHDVTIIVEDNGNGIPESIDLETANSFGLQLIGILTEQISGTIRIERENGTRFALEFNN